MVESDATIEYAGGYRKLVVDALPDTPNRTRHKKEVDEAAGTATFGFNVYEGEPGEAIGWAYHYHPDHEELFYVMQGRIAIETRDGEIVVDRNEAFFVPAGAPQQARIVGDGTARVIAVGAPKESDEGVVIEVCPVCDRETGREVTPEEGAFVLTCSDCGAQVDRIEA